MQNQSFPYDFLRLAVRQPQFDRFSSSDIFYLNSSSDTQGAIAYYLEIEELSRMKQDAIDHITKTIQNGIISPAKSVRRSAHLEDILQKLNLFFNEEITKLGKSVNMLIAFIDDDKIHFAQFGKVNCYLVHDGKPTLLTKLNNRFFFDEITSGGIHPNDWFVISGADLTPKVETADSSVWSYENFDDIASELGLGNSSTCPLGLLMRYQPTNVRNQETLYLDAPVGSPLKPLKISLNIPIKNHLAKFKFKIPNTNTWPKLAPLFKNLLAKWPQKPAKKFQQPLAKPFGGKGFGQYRKFILPVAGILVVSVALVFAYASIKKKFTSDANDTKVTQAVSLLSRISNLGTVDLIAELSKSTFYDEYQLSSDTDKTAITAKYLTTGVTLTAPTLLHTLESPVSQIDYSDNLYVLDQSGQLYFKQGQYLQKIEQDSPIASPYALKTFASQKAIASSASGVTYLMLPTKKPAIVALPNGLTPAKPAWASYENSVYLLDPTSALIYRQQDFADNLDGLKKYVTLGKDAVFTTMAIKEKFYLLSDAGELYTLDTKKNPVKITTPQLFVGGKITANTNYPNLIIAQGKNIYILSEKGEIKRTMYLNQKNPITSISLDSATKTLYVGTTTEVFSLPIAD